MIKCGFDKKCITPPLGAPIVGYYLERRVKGVLDDLYVRASAFDDGKVRAVVIAVDVCYITKDMCDELRKRIAKECNVDENAIHICASHTHTGPLLGKDFASESECPKAYEEMFKTQICDAASYAFMDLKPARFFYGENEAKNISFSRRFKMKDGTVATNPGVCNPDIDYPIGVPDETVRFLKILREGADDLFIVNYGTHTDTVTGEYISADYPAYLCETLERAIPGTKCMFLLGPQGDVNHVNVKGWQTDEECEKEFGPLEGWKLTNDNFGDSEEDMSAHPRHMGRVIAGAVLSALALAKEIKMDKISFATRELTLPSNQENDKLEEAERIAKLYDEGRHQELPYDGMNLVTVVAGARRILSLKDGPECFYGNIYGIKIGDFVFAGMGGEPFVEIGKRIYEGSPFENMIFSCLTNSEGSYYPTSSAMTEGGYEAATCNIRAGADNIIVNNMIELLNELK